tara:strand:- start:5293 stop:5760 length:468 start_codon:yes stop_codon:yes gene_type:complete
MRRVRQILIDGSWEGNVVSSVTLSYQNRYRRKLRMCDDKGIEFFLDLAQTTQLFEGDALVLDDGDLICVKAAKEDILEISCETVNQLTRIAWHIGNRHIPAQFLENNTFRILYDHVLQGMVVGLGARALRKKLPFSPERGAYSDSNISGGHPHAH